MEGAGCPRPDASPTSSGAHSRAKPGMAPRSRRCSPASARGRRPRDRSRPRTPSGRSPRRLAGERVELSDAEDWPPAGAGGEPAWAELVARLEAVNRALREAIMAFDESRLDQPPGAGPTPAYRLMHGIIHHDLYHAGQIAALRKGAGA